MTKAAIRAHRFSLLCVIAAAESVGWSPSQAFALDGPLDPAASTVVGVTDPVLNAVTSTTSGPIDTSNTAPGPVDTVTNTASGGAGTVSNTVGDATTAVNGAVGGAQASAQAVQLSAVTGATSPSRFSSGQQAAATDRSALRLPQSLQDDLVLLAERSQAESAIGDEGHASCVAGVGTACQTRDGAAGSWTRSVANIIRKLLALTGWGLLPWVVASCFLTLAGMLFLYQSRDRSELGSARAS